MIGGDCPLPDRQHYGVAAIILGILALVFMLTSLIGFCPLYVPFKIATISKK